MFVAVAKVSKGFVCAALTELERAAREVHRERTAVRNGQRVEHEVGSRVLRDSQIAAQRALKADRRVR